MNINQSLDTITATQTHPFYNNEPARQKYLVYLGDSRGCVHMNALNLA